MARKALGGITGYSAGGPLVLPKINFNRNRDKLFFSQELVGSRNTFRLEMFKTWNHTEFSGQNSTARFDRNGVQTDPNFGAYTGAFKPRNIQLSLRVMF